MNRLSRSKRAEILTLQVEGMSLRAISRVTSVSMPTILRLGVEAGRACAAEHGYRVRNLRCDHVQIDELWAFVGMKQRNVPVERWGEFGIGDVWTFTAIDADTKLIPTWLIGNRDAATARRFLVDLGRRIDGRFQLTSDGAYFYSETVAEVLNVDVDYAQLVKIFAKDEREDVVDGERVKVKVSTEHRRMWGRPDETKIDTAYIERHNLTLRMSSRRYTRSTNAFSRKVYNLSCSVALFMFYYNFARPHMTLTARYHGKPTTPAMEAGLARHVWSMEDIVTLIEAREESAIDVAKRRKDRRR